LGLKPANLEKFFEGCGCDFCHIKVLKAAENRGLFWQGDIWPGQCNDSVHLLGFLV
jgi:hypothetical protein